ncbi:uncharacterized protein EKO05_0003209 [Ascochyta rabiei]|uniref:uncharacterized protein n=1 Tax=Didymella rabiei TaxID=5454 RepID=UPI0021FE924D|nr:uncharacterized protein EKO05_0003209 [Ascochyta rabiei]UPX12668.1 hypothetical protein EKO05_0003209 [Ascochyta rabiei]
MANTGVIKSSIGTTAKMAVASETPLGCLWTRPEVLHPFCFSYVVLSIRPCHAPISSHSARAAVDLQQQHTTLLPWPCSRTGLGRGECVAEWLLCMTSLNRPVLPLWYLVAKIEGIVHDVR